MRPPPPPPKTPRPIAAFFVSLAGSALVLTMLRYRLALMPWLILFAAYSLMRAREAGRAA